MWLARRPSLQEAVQSLRNNLPVLVPNDDIMESSLYRHQLCMGDPRLDLVCLFVWHDLVVGTLYDILVLRQGSKTHAGA